MKTSYIIFGILAILGFLWYSGKLDLGGALPLNAGACVPVVEIEYTGVTSGFTEVESGNDVVIVAEDGDVGTGNSQLNFTVTTSIIEGCRATDGSYMTHIVTYKPEVYQLRDVDTPSSTTLIDGMDYISVAAGYNISTTSVLYATTSSVTDSLAVGTPAVETLAFGTNTEANYDKLVANDFETVSVAKLGVYVDDALVGTVDIQYMQD